MNLISRVSLLALGSLVGSACRTAGAASVGDGVAAVARVLNKRFTDQGRRVPDAIARAAERAWRSLERVLAGESVLSAVDRAEDRAFRDEVRSFLADVRFDGAQCLLELRAAREAGALSGDADPTALAEQLGDLTRFDDASALVREQWALAEVIASELRASGFGTLAAFLVLKPRADAEPLLAVAVRFYFRRAVEEDPHLFRGVAFAQLEKIGRSQDDTATALAGMATSLDALHTTLRDQDLPLAEEFVEVPTVTDRFRDQTNGVLAVSPDGSRVLGGCKFDGKLRLFDAKTGKELRRLPGHAGWVTCVAFSPDGTRALSGGEDGAVKLWDVLRGKLLRTWPTNGAKPSAVVFTADGCPQIKR